LAKRNPSDDSPNVYSSTREIIHLRVAPKKSARNNNPIYCAARLNYSSGAEPPLFPLSLRKKEEGGAFNWRNQ